jgi:hypothetical protein
MDDDEYSPGASRGYYRAPQHIVGRVSLPLGRTSLAKQQHEQDDQDDKAETAAPITVMGRDVS